MEAALLFLKSEIGYYYCFVVDDGVVSLGIV
jgi:hypothetical protein